MKKRLHQHRLPITRDTAGALRCLLLLLAGGLLLLAAPRSASAGTEDDLRGFLEAIDTSAGTFTVDGVDFTTDGNTEFRDIGGGAIPFSTFMVDDLVRVRYLVDGGAPFLATRLELDDEVRLFGPIDSIVPAESRFEVLGRTVHTDGTTVFLDKDGNPSSFGALGVGAFVEVEGALNGDMSIAAAQVEIEDRFGDNNFRTIFLGALESIDTALEVMVVAGRTVRYNAATEFQDIFEQPILPVDLVVGYFLKVKGFELDDLTFVASEVEIEPIPGDMPGGEFELRGVITELDLTTGLLNVGDRLVRTDGMTQFLGHQNQPIALADFAVGDFVEAEGIVQTDRSILADKVKKEDRVGSPFEIRGTIDSIAGDLFTIGGTPVVSNASTLFLGQANQPLAIGDFMAGEFVEAEGVALADGTLIAEKIKKEDAGATDGCLNAFAFSGAITAIDLGTPSMTVGTRVVLVEPGTELKDAARLPIMLNAFVVDEIVEVKAVDNGDGTWTGCEIEKARGGADDGLGDLQRIRVVGAIETIDTPAASMTVAGTVVATTMATTYGGITPDVVLTFDDFVVGDRVAATGRFLADGRLSAESIRLIGENVDPGRPSVVATGLIVALALPGTLTLNDGTIVDLSGNPTVRLFEDTPGTINDLAVGDFAQVGGHLQLDDTLRAEQIETRGGTLGAIDLAGNTLTVGNATVIVDGMTEIREADNTPLALGDLVVGDLLRIESVATVRGVTITAREIVRIETPFFSGAVATFDPVTGSVNDDGQPTIQASASDNVYGFINLPVDAYAPVANSLYLITLSVSGNMSDPTLAPDIRVRANNQSFQKAMTAWFLSINDARYSPTPTARDYRAIYVPGTEPDDRPEISDDWFVSLDLLNFASSANDPAAAITLEGVRVEPIPFASVAVDATLYSADFAIDSQGWQSGGALGFFDLPSASSAQSGTLDLAANTNDTHGYWFVDTGVAIEGGAIYRARFHARVAAGERAKTPTIRGRLNSSDFQLAATTWLVSEIDGSESPDDEAGRLVDVYMMIPAGPTNGSTLIASFDIIQIATDDDLFRAVSLDSFVLERIALP